MSKPRRHISFLPSAIFIMTLPLLSCAGVPGHRSASFDPEEYKPYAKAGTASVSGHVFMKGEDGAVTSGSGCREIYLEPVTTYSTEWVERELLRNQKLDAPDPRALTYRRTTHTDGTGVFRFERLPAGSYYVACRMQFSRYIMTGAGRPTLFEELVWVHSRIDLEAGEQGRVTLAH